MPCLFGERHLPAQPVHHFLARQPVAGYGALNLLLIVLLVLTMSSSVQAVGVILMLGLLYRTLLARARATALALESIPNTSVAPPRAEAQRPKPPL